MTIFTETALKAICDYRQLLKRYLNPIQRDSKLEELNLKNGFTHYPDTKLFRIAQNIVTDIERNLGNHSQGYYAYSGVRKFGEYLKDFLNEHEVEGEAEVVHRTQKASRILLEAIQLINLPKERLTPATIEKLTQCNEILASFGSAEQQSVYREAIERMRERNEVFYSSLLRNFLAHRASEDLSECAE